MTKHLARNIVIAVLLAAAAIAGVNIYYRFTNRRPTADTLIAPAKDEGEGSEEKPDTTPADEVDAISTLNVDAANHMIRDYYTMLATLDFAGLRSIGCDSAAGAIELGWVAQIGLEIRPELLVPNADSLPSPVGTYAGNDLYAIADFYKAAPAANSVKSIITGETGPVGWIYHDAFDDAWHVVDPVLPTGTQAPAASVQSRQSTDGLVNVELSSPGVFRNQWWAMTMVTAAVTSRSTTYGVGVTSASFDSGMRVTVPETLLVGISASEVPVVPQVLPDGTQAPLEKRINGVCTIVRGSTTEFDIGRIGQSLMRLDGDNLSPISVVANEEEVAPIFPVNNETASSTARLLNQEQIEQYGLTGSTVMDQTPVAGAAAADPSAQQQAAQGASAAQPAQGAAPAPQAQAQAADGSYSAASAPVSAAPSGRR